jgi:3-hydroxymyristoyl/3-hydroxydecanoyl-(acyl carrier protein) dehydratase
MDDHFRAFSFVDQITQIEPGGCVRGRYRVPSNLQSFPSALAAEAVGQLAAWGAMAVLDFTHRPLAGIAGQVELLAPVNPGDPLDLAADLESVDRDSAVYSGEVRVDGKPVIRLRDCVGPMVPLPEYDDPAAVRARYDLIRSSGASPGAFAGTPPLALDPSSADESRHCLHARLAIPEEAPLFADHFPRRAVFPGTLLMHANLELARRLVAERSNPVHGAAWVPRKITSMKLRTFIPPGADLLLEARRAAAPTGRLLLDVETRIGRRVVGTAQVHFTRDSVA